MFSKIEVLTMLLGKILEVDYEKLEGRVELAPNNIPNRTVDEIKNDEELWGRLYIREEEDVRIREGIIAEERADARKEAFKEGFDDGFNDGFNNGSTKTRKEIILKMK